MSIGIIAMIALGYTAFTADKHSTKQLSQSDSLFRFHCADFFSNKAIRHEAKGKPVIEGSSVIYLSYSTGRKITLTNAKCQIEENYL